LTNLKQRFGHLVAANRHRLRLTQGQLAEAADLSEDMISRIETGVTGARFPTIERLAGALGIDPGELFSADFVPGRPVRIPLRNLTAKLSRLSDRDLEWAERILDAAVASRK
jgi:transcriptional regulator with XRE-family HTH domain